MEPIQILSWVAVIVLASSYWFQIWKIHVHREVRDLSVTFYVLLAIGYIILTFTALHEDTLIFFVKQLASLLPVVILIGQIVYHRKDHWHDDQDQICKKCKEELEPHWNHCAFCSRKVTSY